MLEDAIREIANVLRTVSANAGAVDPIQVIEEPGPSLPAVRQFLFFEQPGDSVIAEQHGRHGGLVYQIVDVIFVEYHRKIQRDHPDFSTAEVRSLHGLVIDALWSGFQRTNFNRTVLGLTRIATDGYGPDNYGSDVSFGFRLALEITRRSETVSGRMP